MATLPPRPDSPASCRSRAAAPHARRLASVAALVSALSLGGCIAGTTVVQGPVDPSGRPAEPEAATRAGAGPRGALPDTRTARGDRTMVVAAHPLATQAAAAVLREGGHAIDAAIAAQFVLAVVEPQSSGPGGGGFLLHFDPGSRRVDAWDGRETAPAALRPLGAPRPDGRRPEFHDVAVGGAAVGAPGLVAMLEAAHRAHGALAWTRLVAPAVELARTGAPMGERLHALLSRDPFLRLDPVAAAIWYGPDGRPRPIGTPIPQPALAATLQSIARDGARALREGPVAEAIVAAVRGHRGNPGILGPEDLAAYRPVRRDPVCAPALGHVVCGMPPPSAGAVTTLQLIGLWEAAGRVPLLTPEGRWHEAGAHLFAEAGRLAYADRDRWLGDPDGALRPPPVAGLLDPAYLRARASAIGPRAASAAAPPGRPPGTAEAGADPAPGRPPERTSTTHVSVVDAAGRAVALTSSIEDAFGARVMAAGMLLNNQLTDFSLGAPDDHPNAPRPLRRPRSSMAPTLVFDRMPADGGSVRAVIGSPGGPAIPAYVARTLIGVLADGLPPAVAVAAPHLANRNGTTDLEAGRWPANTRAALAARGHAVRELDMTSGIHGIIRECAGGRCRWLGVADPRREGLALGDRWNEDD